MSCKRLDLWDEICVSASLGGGAGGGGELGNREFLRVLGKEELRSVVEHICSINGTEEFMGNELECRDGELRSITVPPFLVRNFLPDARYLPFSTCGEYMHIRVTSIRLCPIFRL